MMAENVEQVGFGVEVQAMRFGETLGESNVMGVEGQVGVVVTIQGVKVNMLLSREEAARFGGELVGASLRASMMEMLAAGERR